MEKFLRKNQKGLYIVIDVFFIVMSFIASAVFLDMFERLHGTYYYIVCILLYCALHCVSFESFRLYNVIWLYAGVYDYIKVLRTMIIDFLL